MRADADPGKVVLACQRCIIATFSNERWHELGYLTGTHDVIANHNRLLRSLYWRDEDYPACVLSILPRILGHAYERLIDVHEYLGLRRWLQQNEPSLAANLYGVAVIEPQPADLANLTDPTAILEHLDRLHRSLGSDPAQTLGTAKELIESTAKLVLSELGETMTAVMQFPSLVDAAQKALALHPLSVAPTEQGGTAARRVLGGLATIARGVDELRNLYGTGHGRIAGSALKSSSLPQLAADAAMTWCRAVLATLPEIKSGRI
jgi:hypothetical protein